MSDVIPIVNADVAQNELLRNAAVKRAHADPLPGPLTLAFCSGPIDAGGQKVRKVVPSTFVFLKAIDSPLIGMMQDIVTGADEIESDFTDEEAWDICWIFTHSPADIRAKLELGKDEIRKISTTEIGDEWEPGTVTLVIAAVMEQFKRHLLTTVKYAAEAQEKGEITFFQDSQTSQKTDLAG